MNQTLLSNPNGFLKAKSQDSQALINIEIKNEMRDIEQLTSAKMLQSIEVDSHANSNK